MVTIGVIPARGGSTRIPGKNKRVLGKKPLVQWTIDAALGAVSLDAVVVSSDDGEILEIATQAGATTLGPRLEFADDSAPSSAATIYEARRFEAHSAMKVSTLVQLLPTCPFRTSETIDRLVAEWRRLGGPSLISAAEPMGMNAWWAAVVDEDGRSEAVRPAAMKLRSQDLGRILFPSGAVWVGSRQTVFSSATFYSDDYRMVPIPWVEAFDIDTPEEFTLAERLSR